MHGVAKGAWTGLTWSQDSWQATVWQLWITLFLDINYLSSRYVKLHVCNDPYMSGHWSIIWSYYDSITEAMKLTANSFILQVKKKGNLLLKWTSKLVTSVWRTPAGHGVVRTMKSDCTYLPLAMSTFMTRSLLWYLKLEIQNNHAPITCLNGTIYMHATLPFYPRSLKQTVCKWHVCALIQDAWQMKL